MGQSTRGIMAAGPTLQQPRSRCRQRPNGGSEIRKCAKNRALSLDKKVYYGYEILQELSKYPIITSTESTVYPLLRRLQKENYLQSTWQESTEGLPPRKYYSLTPDGKNYLDAMNTEWENLLNAMSDLKGE